MLPARSKKIVKVNVGDQETDVMIINKGEIDKKMIKGESVGVTRTSKTFEAFFSEYGIRHP